MEQVDISEETWERLKSDDEFYKLFIKNIGQVLDETRPFSFYVLEDYLGDLKIKKLIMKNLPLVIKKTSNKGELLNYLVKTKKANQYARDFLSESEPGVDTAFSDIIIRLKNYVIKDKSELLALIVENIDNIIIGSGIYLPTTFEEIARYYKNASQEQIKIIDEALAKNIDKITTFKIEEEFYDFNIFAKMEKFKDEIRKRGKQFFVKFPLSNSIEECQEISQEIFGDFDEESFAAMMFGKGDENRSKLICGITKELLKSSKNNNKVSDIMAIGSGCYSDVYQIGDYVLKIGRERRYGQIPNHRRILQPIIRRNVNGKNNENEKKYCVEVQNLVDIFWMNGMKKEEIKEELYKIYADMREDGIVWFDIGEQNVGRLLRRNNPNFYFTDVDGIKKDIRPTYNAIGMGEKNKKQTLEKREYVVLDTDYIAPYDKQKMLEQEYVSPRAELTYEFEERYLKELKEKKENGEKKNEYR